MASARGSSEAGVVGPFELSWMCGIEPSNLAGELPQLKIGRDSVDWYQEEIDRFHELANQFIHDTSELESDDKGESDQIRAAEYKKLLIGFSGSFLKA